MTIWVLDAGPAPQGLLHSEACVVKMFKCHQSTGDARVMRGPLSLMLPNRSKGQLNLSVRSFCQSGMDMCPLGYSVCTGGAS